MRRLRLAVLGALLAAGGGLAFDRTATNTGAGAGAGGTFRIVAVKDISIEPALALSFMPRRTSCLRLDPLGNRDLASICVQ